MEVKPIEQKDVIQVPDDESEEKIELDEDTETIELREAKGPAIKFYSKSTEKDDLKMNDKTWAKYISTYAPFNFRDRNNPTITYENMEAAIGAEKYKVATNKPDLGQTLFATFGTIHQKYEEARSGVTDSEELKKLTEEEGSAYRTEQSEKTMGKHKATFNKEKWDNVKEAIIADYARQRFERDEKFRKIIQKAGELEVKLVYYTDTKGSNELGGIIKDGAIIGENLYGRALMELVGLGYE